MLTNIHCVYYIKKSLKFVLTVMKELKCVVNSWFWTPYAICSYFQCISKARDDRNKVLSTKLFYCFHCCYGDTVTCATLHAWFCEKVLAMTFYQTVMEMFIDRNP